MVGDGDKVKAPDGFYYSNGKSENGVSFRTPNAPNACSEVRAHTEHRTYEPPS